MQSYFLTSQLQVLHPTQDKRRPAPPTRRPQRGRACPHTAPPGLFCLQGVCPGGCTSRLTSLQGQDPRRRAASAHPQREPALALDPDGAPFLGAGRTVSPSTPGGHAPCRQVAERPSRRRNFPSLTLRSTSLRLRSGQDGGRGGRGRGSYPLELTFGGIELFYLNLPRNGSR